MKSRFAEATGTNSGNPIDGSQTTLPGCAPIQTAPMSQCVISNKHLSDVPGSAPGLLYVDTKTMTEFSSACTVKIGSCRKYDDDHKHSNRRRVVSSVCGGHEFGGFGLVLYGR